MILQPIWLIIISGQQREHRKRNDSFEEKRIRFHGICVVYCHAFYNLMENIVEKSVEKTSAQRGSDLISQFALSSSV